MTSPRYWLDADLLLVGTPAAATAIPVRIPGRVARAGMTIRMPTAGLRDDRRPPSVAGIVQGCSESARQTSGSREIPDLNAGDRVLHPRFGMGTVVTVTGEGDKSEASVDFGGEGVKRLLLRYAPVEKL